MKGHLRVAAACVLTATLAGAALVHAHEIGTTRVSVLVQESRHYDIRIVTDAASLVEKLEAVAGNDRRALSSSESGVAAVRERLVAFDDIFRQRLTLAFDGVAAHPAIAYAVFPAADATAPILATIRFY